MGDDSKLQQLRRFRIGCVLVFALTVLISGGLIWNYSHYLDSEVPVSETRRLEIQPNWDADDVLDLLADEGLVERRFYAELFLRLNGLDGKIKAGTFEVVPGMPVRTLLESLAIAPEDRQAPLTFPEGWRLDQMADMVEQLGFSTANAFLAALDERDTLDHGLGWEGYLFPDTYFVTSSTPVDVLHDRMLERHREVWVDLAEEHAESMDELFDQFDLEPSDLVIIASIVEAEATVPEEYAIIARVIYNRLGRGMRLQMDPTCAYLPEYREIPLHRACHDADNPYSTYEIDGLPPTAIGNPGRLALEAAMRPDPRPESASLLYFVARQDGSGRHVFAETYEEHTANVNRYLRD